MLTGSFFFLRETGNPTFAKITDYNFHLRPGRKEIIDGMVELLFGRQSDIDTLPKDTSEENFDCLAVAANFGTLLQFLSCLCMLS